MNTTLYFWRREKNQETLMYLCVFWERNMVRKERKKCPKMHKQLPKTQFFGFGPIWGVRGYLQPLACFLRNGTPCGADGWARRLHKVRRANVIMTSTNSSCCTFWFQLQMSIQRSSWTPIEAILVCLESSRCLVFRKLNKLKFQWLDQKL